MSDWGVRVGAGNSDEQEFLASDISAINAKADELRISIVDNFLDTSAVVKALSQPFFQTTEGVRDSFEEAVRSAINSAFELVVNGKTLRALNEDEGSLTQSVPPLNVADLNKRIQDALPQHFSSVRETLFNGEEADKLETMIGESVNELVAFSKERIAQRSRVYLG